jgi:hypothetical protein
VHPIGQFEITHGKLGVVGHDNIRCRARSSSHEGASSVSSLETASNQSLEMRHKGPSEIKILQFFRADVPADAEDAENIRIVNKTNSLFMVYLSLKVMLKARDISTILGPTSLLTLKRSDF